MKIKISTDTAKVIRALSKYRVEGVPDGITKVLDANAAELTSRAKLKAPIYDGDIRASLKWSKDDKKFTFERTIYADSAIAPHAGYTEFGTGGKVSVPAELDDVSRDIQKQRSLKTFAQGLEAITQWAKKNGIEESAAGGIFRAILQDGVSPQPFLYPSLVSQRIVLLKDLQAMLEKLGRKYSIT